MPCKVCPECGEGGMGVRTLKCKSCGYEFMKSKNAGPKKPPKLKFDSTDEDEQEEQDEKVEDFSRVNHATKKITLSLDDEEKLTVDKLSQHTRPFNRSIEDNKLVLEGSVMIVGRGMDDCTHKSTPILPCHAVYAKIVADPKDGTLSVWVLTTDGNPDRVYINAVA